MTIEFLNTDPPTVNIDGKVQPLNAEGEIKAGQVTLTVTPHPNAASPNSLTFDYQGNLPPDTTPFVVTIAPAGSSGGKQCAIVQTLIGGMRTAEGNDCQTP
ncbi:MAG: hypothetical protein HC849_16825 [Oscillatoriales cyanobacterium RU_3_3]|nr:hypothetical protein [Oscillatoriales cyanobacterium RU_3_3]